MRTRQVVISNEPASDPRSGGLPRGHPPLESFAGIPFLHGERLVGMVGIANRPGGYSDELLRGIAPLLDTMRTLIVAHRAERERARAQERLRASEAEHRKLATVASLTSNIVFVTGPAGEIEWVNDAFVRITGYSLEEARGRTPMDLLHGPLTDRGQVRRMAELLARGAPVTGFEIANYAKNGQPYWVAIEIQPVRDARGEIVQYVALESDVSAAREAEREWRASQARFVAAFHGASDYQVITRISDGVFIEVNAAALELTGLTREQMIGHTANDLGLWADPSQRIELQARLARDGNVSGFPLHAAQLGRRAARVPDERVAHRDRHGTLPADPRARRHRDQARRAEDPRERAAAAGAVRQRGRRDRGHRRARHDRGGESGLRADVRLRGA